MGFRDRFYTPHTAKAILSWRLVLGVGVGVLLGAVGVGIGWAVAAGVAVYAASVLAAMPKPPQQARIDPFVLSEPWRQLVQATQAAQRKLHATVDGVADGPLKQRLADIAAQIERGIAQSWQIARRGDEIDDSVRALDPTALRSKLATLEDSNVTRPSADIEAAIGSVRSQLDSAARLKQQSIETADQLRLTQTQLDELVARANELKIGAAGDQLDAYAHDVDDIVLQLEAMRQAIEETRTA
jgi:hypothetical protein